MNKERFLEIIKDTENKIKCDLLMSESKCNVLRGLNIIAKYLPDSGVGLASHDVILACSVDALLAAGITAEDAIILRRLNWGVNGDEWLHCFI